MKTQAIDGRNSVNCYFCGVLFDEREGLNADDFNNNDGGSICQNCFTFRLRPEELASLEAARRFYL